VIESPEDAELAARVAAARAALAAGEAVILPTDTVYGLAALPGVPGAVTRLFALKGRADTQPLAVLVADPAQGLTLVEPPSPAVQRLIDRYWPGPLTLVLSRTAEARRLELGGSDDTIGIRCPDQPLVRDLASDLGPIATTSANLHGEPTPAVAAAAAAKRSGPVAVVVEAGPLDGQPSTVVDGCGETLVVLREGVIAEADILSVAGG
jgi:L-threonylcarbamoyladenylate synthase